MKNLTLVCLEDDKVDAVSTLRELGCVQVRRVVTPDSPEADSLRKKLDTAQKIVSVLKAHHTGKGHEDTNAEALCEEVGHLLTEMHQLDEKHTHLHRMIKHLEPWGTYDKDLIAELKKGGYDVFFTAYSADKEPELPEGAVDHVVNEIAGKLYAVVVAPSELNLTLDHSMALPEETDMQELENQVAACVTRQNEISDIFAEKSVYINVVEKYVEYLASEIEYLDVRDGMEATQGLAWLSGYIPEVEMDKVAKAAEAKGWALQHSDADKEDPEVPTLLKVPKAFKISKPIFDFIGILPSYSEADVSISVLIFLTLFFGMIIGDAGYGVIFIALGLFAKSKMKTKEAKLPVNLFLLMSIVTTVWGGLSGNWFAIPQQSLPEFMQGCDWLTEAAVKDKHVQWFCFLVGAIHLSMARIWQAVINCKSKDAVGHIGWALLIWANFFVAVELIVEKGSMPQTLVMVLYIAGALAVMVCGVNWKDVGDILNLPFGFIGSFVDVLSYIRLFAVGLSSYFIADSFNNMGKMVFDIAPWLIPFGVIIIVFGHLLNIALGFMGVLVHGIRLNTLEFSNHMGLTWSGKKFSPLKKVPCESGE